MNDDIPPQRDALHQALQNRHLPWLVSGVIYLSGLSWQAQVDGVSPLALLVVALIAGLPLCWAIRGDIRRGYVTIRNEPVSRAEQPASFLAGIGLYTSLYTVATVVLGLGGARYFLSGLQ